MEMEMGGWVVSLHKKTCVIKSRHTHTHTHAQWQAVAGNFHLDWQKDLPPKAATIIHVQVGTGAGAGTGSIRRRWFPCEWPKKSTMKTYGNINGQLTQKIHGKHTQHTQHTERVDYGNVFPVCSLWTWADHYKNAICAIRRREMTQTETQLNFYFTTWAGPGIGRRHKNSNTLSTKAV